MKRMFLDIETSPCVGYFWKPGYRVTLSYENIIVEPRIICACWKWEGSREIYGVDWGKKQMDNGLCRRVIAQMDRADEIVAHYGEGFDVPWIRGRCLYHEIPCKDAYKVVDTCKMAGKRKFRLNSRKLDYLAQYLGLGRKIKEDYELWKKVMDRQDGAMQEMLRYCKRDVVLLEKVYRKLAQYSPAATHRGVLEGGEKWQCPHCGGTNVVQSKKNVTAVGTVRYQLLCKQCHRYHSVCQKAHTNWLEWKYENS